MREKKQTDIQTDGLFTNCCKYKHPTNFHQTTETSSVSFSWHFHMREQHSDIGLYIIHIELFSQL